MHKAQVGECVVMFILTHLTVRAALGDNIIFISHTKILQQL